MPLLLRLLFDLANLALDLSSLTDAVTQIVELCTANTALTNNDNVLYVRGMQREYTLHAYAVGNTANREGLAYTGTLAGNNCAFELLNSFTLTLADVYVDTDGIANVELRCLLLNGIGSNKL